MPATRARAPATHNINAKKWTICAPSCRHAGGGGRSGKTFGPSRASRAATSSGPRPCRCDGAERTTATNSLMPSASRASTTSTRDQGPPKLGLSTLVRALARNGAWSARIHTHRRDTVKVLEGLGVEGGDHVFGLLPRIPEVHVDRPSTRHPRHTRSRRPGTHGRRHGRRRRGGGAGPGCCTRRSGLGPSSSNCAPTASGRIRCTTPSSGATHRGTFGPYRSGGPKVLADDHPTAIAAAVATADAVIEGGRRHDRSRENP